MPTRKILFKGGMAGMGAVKPVVEFMATILGGTCGQRGADDVSFNHELSTENGKEIAEGCLNTSP